MQIKTNWLQYPFLNSSTKLKDQLNSFVEMVGCLYFGFYCIQKHFMSNKRPETIQLASSCSKSIHVLKNISFNLISIRIQNVFEDFIVNEKCDPFCINYLNEYFHSNF